MYVADYDNDRVEKFTSTGTFLIAWGCADAAKSACPSGSGNGQFNGPVGVAVDSSGHVYVTDQSNNRVEKFTNNGVFLTAWGCADAANSGCSYGSSTPGQFHSPAGVAVDSSGNVYVADSGNNRVEKFTSDGTYVTQVASSGFGPGNVGHFNAPNGVAVDFSGNLYIADTGNNFVEKFDSSGNFLLALGSTNASNPQFNQPKGVAFDSSGNVYVVDKNHVEEFGDLATTSTSLSTSSISTATGSTSAISATSTAKSTVFSSTANQCISTSTGNANACLAVSAGTFSALTTSAVSSLSTPPPVGLMFPFGLFSFTISGLSPTQTVIVTLTLPSSLPAGVFSYWKLQGSTWTELSSSQVSLDSKRSVVTLTLIASNGVIVDPGGPAIAPASTVTSSSTAGSTSTIPASGVSSTNPISTTTIGPTSSSMNSQVFSASNGGSLTDIAIGIVVVVVVALVGVFLALRTMRRKGNAVSSPFETTSPQGVVGATFCYSCGRQLENYARFCDKCGAIQSQ